MSESNNFDYKELYSLNYYRWNKDKLAEHKHLLSKQQKWYIRTNSKHKL